jgi:hypothetical protein
MNLWESKHVWPVWKNELHVAWIRSWLWWKLLYRYDELVPRKRPCYAEDIQLLRRVRGMDDGWTNSEVDRLIDACSWTVAGVLFLAFVL